MCQSETVSKIIFGKLSFEKDVGIHTFLCTVCPVMRYVLNHLCTILLCCNAPVVILIQFRRS